MSLLAKRKGRSLRYMLCDGNMSHRRRMKNGKPEIRYPSEVKLRSGAPILIWMTYMVAEIAPHIE